MNWKNNLKNALEGNFVKDENNSDNFYKAQNETIIPSLNNIQKIIKEYDHPNISCKVSDSPFSNIIVKIDQLDRFKIQIEADDDFNIRILLQNFDLMAAMAEDKHIIEKEEVIEVNLNSITENMIGDAFYKMFEKALSVRK